jgi:hypothetical protein
MAEKLDTPWWSEMVMYWLENQVAITFHSDTLLNPEQDSARRVILNSLCLDDLSTFLQGRGFKLKPCNAKNLPHTSHTGGDVSHVHDDGDVNDPCGKYLFSSPAGQGTFVVGFFNVERLEIPHPVQDMRLKHGSGITYDRNDSNARQIVKLINCNLDKLRQEGRIPVISAMPNWLGGATGCITHGCSVIPLPVETEDICASPNCWTITLPGLSDTMKAKKGKGVTVFVLDTMPKLEQIEKADQVAEGSNWLLHEIVEQMKAGSIVARYQPMPELLAESAEDLLVTGRDIYGRPSGFKMPDHGLFVTGVIRDLAPDAKIEYFRVLNDYGVGDIHTLMYELEKIHRRMMSGDLHGEHVVINLALVMMPPHDELPHFWFSDEGSFQGEELIQMMREAELLRTPLHLAIQSLTALGAVIVAAAGNDSNTPDMPGRMVARYPAAFPEVISVGAVDQSGNAAPYSDYPALPPCHNGIATYGGGQPIPGPSSSDAGAMTSVEAAKPIDALRGIYSSPIYPALSADDPVKENTAPNKSAWAYWPGTSFATAIISALAARVLEKMKSSNEHLPSSFLAPEVQWAITTAKGQQTILTGNGPLPLQPEFGVSLLKAVQVCEERKRVA